MLSKRQKPSLLLLITSKKLDEQFHFWWMGKELDKKFEKENHQVIHFVDIVLHIQLLKVWKP